MAANLTPDMDMTDDRGPQVIRAAVACSVLSGLAFAGRIVSRKASESGLLDLGLPARSRFAGCIGCRQVSLYGVKPYFDTPSSKSSINSVLHVRRCKVGFGETC